MCVCVCGGGGGEGGEVLVGEKYFSNYMLASRHVLHKSSAEVCAYKKAALSLINSSIAPRFPNT